MLAVLEYLKPFFVEYLMQSRLTQTTPDMRPMTHLEQHTLSYCSPQWQLCACGSSTEPGKNENDKNNNETSL